ncbi:hypothetical protein AAG570_010806 [Ranatra chinensis]|uniref:Transposase n=1 Tax=Ranatra chinensis TaxID=642074 RepID=A0ABD0ZBY3_9HEMI
MASKRRNMFQKNKTQETTENGLNLAERESHNVGADKDSLAAHLWWPVKGQKSVLLVDLMVKETTINAEKYYDTLKNLIKDKKRGMLNRVASLVHNNARPHTALVVQDLFKSFGWAIVTQPVYSPDRVDDDEMNETVEKWLSQVGRSAFDEGMKMPVLRLKKCTEVDDNTLRN